MYHKLCGQKKSVVLAMEDSQFNLNCTHFTEEQLKLVNLTRGITSILCTAFATIIFLFLLCHKSYSTLLQRLFLYLLADTIIVEIINMFSLEHQIQYSKQEQVCEWLAFLTHWTTSTMLFAAFGIILYLFCLVTVQIRGNCHLLVQLKQRRCFQCIVEGAFAILPFLLAFSLAWVPYTDGDYGIAGPWCWIRTLDDNCEPLGLKNQMIYFGMYELVGVIGIITSTVFAVVYCRLSTAFSEAQRLLRQTLILMLFQLVYILTILYQMIMRLYTGSKGQHDIYALWIIYAVISPSRQLIFPLGCLICFYPVKSMLSCRAWNFQSSKQRHYQNRGETSSVPESTRVSPWSHTYFIAPHESCTEESTFSTVPPKSTDTGYGSIPIVHTEQVDN